MKATGMKKRILVYMMIAVFAITLLPSVFPAARLVSEASERNHFVVVLDPGHGGYSSGTVNFGMMEKDANLTIALACRDYLMQYENIDVYMTRSDDSAIELDERTDYAVSKNADLVVSLHNNAALEPGPNGVCVYISRVQPFYNNTRQLAQNMCNSISTFGINNLGVMTRACTLPDCPDDDYYALIAGPAYYGIPGMIVEHAFMSNPHDAAILANQQNLKQMGIMDARCIANYFNAKLKTDAPNGIPTLQTRAYMQNYGWIATAPNGMVSGFETYRDNDLAGNQGSRHGRDCRMEALKIDVTNNGMNGNIEYSVFIGKSGNAAAEKKRKGNVWMPYVKNGKTAGTMGESRAIEGIRIRLTDQLAVSYDVYYRLKVGNRGWMGWACNDSPAGTPGEGQKVRAIQVKLVVKGQPAPGSTDNSYIPAIAPDEACVQYRTHIQSFGWENGVKFDGMISGTTGLSRRLEAIEISKAPVTEKIKGDIEYRVHCQTYGWMNWVKNGEMAGTSGESKRLEAIQIRLTGKLAEKYDVYYRVHAQHFGWMNWAKNGKIAGTAGYGYRLEAIQIKLVKKNGEAPINDTTNAKAYSHPLIGYRTHVQSVGWQSDAHDGEVSGTMGRSLRLESIVITNKTGISGDLRYRVHCQTFGWTHWKRSGQEAGTTGLGKRLEAIQLCLTGDLKKEYDVYYRVHAQHFGWMDWAKNGEMAGTAGYAYRLEAIQIVLVKKGGAAPGNTAVAFLQK